jgi:hypothetical protein
MPELQHDPLQKPAELVIGKKTYKLGFDFEAIAKAEAATGMSLIFGIDWSSIGVKRLEGMLHASMSIYQPNITLEEIRSIIKPRNVKKIESALVEAWFLANPEPSDEAGEAVNPQ